MLEINRCVELVPKDSDAKDFLKINGRFNRNI